MRRLIALFVALALSGGVLGVVVRSPVAQVEDTLLDACEEEERQIRAAALPEVVAPGACPVEGRPVVDGAVTAVVPPPGESVYAEALTTTGAQELEVNRLADGSIEVGHVGDDTDDVAEFDAGDLARAVRGPGECSDTAFTYNGWRVKSALHYRFNGTRTPARISRRAARTAVIQAGQNVTATRGSCRVSRGRISAALRYKGGTKASAQVGNGLCGRDDGMSVVSFGNLKSGVLAATCVLVDNAPGYDRVASSDAKINHNDFRWTVNPLARSCNRRWDIQSVMTHEWGHTFGLGHVLEDGHGKLTMSAIVNGPCQKSERSLGRGDVLGLDTKYPG